MEIEKNKKDENEIEEDKFIKNIEKISEFHQAHKYIFRVCLLGDAAVGKTSLLTRFCDNSFKENYSNTIGVDFRIVTLKFKNIISKLHIWDTAGQERFRSLALNYLNNSHGFIFVYDITNKQSFNNVVNWINLALEKNRNYIANFLVGNKSDMDDERIVTKKGGENLAKEKKLFFMETSAKKDCNVEKLFYYFLYKMIEFYKSNEYSEDGPIRLKQGNSKEINTKQYSENKCKC